MFHERAMKLNALAILAAFSLLSGTILAKLPDRPSAREERRSFFLTAQNPSKLSRVDEVVGIDLNKIMKLYPSFNGKAFHVTFQNREVPSQLDDENADGVPDELLFITSFSPHEKKVFAVAWTPDTVENHFYAKRTQALLGVKTGYQKLNGYYTGGKFVNVDSAIVPADHFAHDALYRIEGPGWESDKIVYRYYLDSRNRNDIFGKKTNDLVLQKIGVNDLVSDSKESYSKMLDWGMDIFKVGESLGIGSIAMWRDSSVVTISDVQTVKCYILNGPIRSGVFTKYLGWKVGSKNHDLYSNLSISAGSRLTKVKVFVDDSTIKLCTGLARHEKCNLLKSYPGGSRGWAYIALYGEQSLAGDDLGIAIFYKKKDEATLTHDSSSYIVVLRPTNEQLTYYFAAAWQAEPNGIKDQKEFRRYSDNTIERLNNQIKVSL